MKIIEEILGLLKGPRRQVRKSNDCYSKIMNLILAKDVSGFEKAISKVDDIFFLENYDKFLNYSVSESSECVRVLLKNEKSRNLSKILLSDNNVGYLLYRSLISWKPIKLLGYVQDAFRLNLPSSFHALTETDELFKYFLYAISLCDSEEEYAEYLNKDYFGQKLYEDEKFIRVVDEIIQERKLNKDFIIELANLKNRVEMYKKFSQKFRSDGKEEKKLKI
ncbi:hypothetical protein DFLDMN_001636 [Cupriavidus sp. H19C3]|uniref:hypothetical protein n=1 Tax=Cupriavidus sp. H19C3 TaxID=3241603 RepID=UPI003BF7DF09